MSGRLAFTALWLTACGFSSPAGPTLDATPAPDAAIDAPSSVTCANLTCDPNATCAMTSVPACLCKSGFTGDGVTCVDVNECTTNNGGCPAACMNTAGSRVCYAPASCADIKSHVAGAADGSYTLYLGGDAAKPWTAFCAGMASTPHEYLSLTGMNFAQYTQGGKSPGTNVRTTYTRVRFDPATLRINISDRTFATSTGTLRHDGGTQVTSMPYGVAMDCAGDNSRAGVAQVDLTGTSFAISNAIQFIKAGNSPGGTVQMPDGRHFTVTGGGNCGWAGPVNTPFNPFNNAATPANGAIIPLSYAP